MGFGFISRLVCFQEGRDIEMAFASNSRLSRTGDTENWAWMFLPVGTNGPYRKLGLDVFAGTIKNGRTGPRPATRFLLQGYGKRGTDKHWSESVHQNCNVRFTEILSPVTCHA